MKETLYVLLGVFLTAAVGDQGSPAPWRTHGGRNHPQSRVHAHSGLTVVDPPKFAPPPRSSRRGGPLPGYLPLRPVPTVRHPRWYGAETAPKPSYSRPPSQYERFPPFWGDDGHKSHQTRNRRPPQNSFRHAKKDCNPCNSVPWIPIFKSPIGLSSDHHPRELVPHVEVYPEPSVHQPALLLPQTVTQNLHPVPASSISADLSPPVIVEASQDLSTLPVGNYPVSPELLLPPQQQIPFPELSPVPVAPVHQSVSFVPDSQGLVPPVPPKSSSNVVVTISESDHPQDVHLDQYSEQSSLVDAHAPHQHYYRPHNGGVDIVKSVPLAEYTSSIEYPFHYIQSPAYIDINTRPNNTHTLPETYEKPPQTGTQKVSDYLLGISQDPDQKRLIEDSSPAASIKEPSQTATSVENTKEIRQESSYRGLLDPNILTPPPLPPQLTQLLPTFDTAFLHPLFPVENRGIASAVNGALLPPPYPQPMNPTSVQPSETTVPPKKIQIIIPYTTINSQEYDQNAVGSGLQPINESIQETQKRQTLPPIIVTESTGNQPRKAPAATQDFHGFKNSNWNEGQPSESNQVKHIIASNIRDLLKKEMEPKPEQNIRLQKNIDNWTALEYSNHKVVGKKDPGEVISHAQAVTSIPGTSISHLLLPSKKIPDGYFTTAAANFDDPATTPFPATSVSVNSKPFTTITRYSTVTKSGPSQRTTRILHSPSTTVRPDHENEIPEETTPGQNWSNLKVSIAPGTNEKVYVVTPVSNWTSGRRSTRHIDTTEKYSPSKTTSPSNIIESLESKKTHNSLPITTEKTQTEIFTRLEKVNQFQSLTDDKHKPKNKLYPKSTPLFRVKGNQTRLDKLSKFNKPKPIEKFFATSTNKPVSEETISSSTNLQDRTTTTDFLKTTTSTTELPLSTMTEPNLIFPFRNGGELPLEMAQVNFSASELMFKNTGERKTLIKQVKVNNRRGKVGGNKGIARLIAKTSTEESTTTSLASSTTEIPVNLQVDVVYPHKKGETKKPTVYGQKKMPQKPSEKPGGKPPINPDEPNITEDDREDINSLTSGLEGNETETLLAVERGMPRGVFGETKPDNSSRSLLDTIKLLRDFLADMSEEEESQEKHQQLGKVIEKIDATKEKKKLESKASYKYNFPEFLTSELNLSKDEMNLIEGAMVELRKNKTRRKEETKQ